MDRKSKILVAVLLVLIVASAGYTFYKIMIKRDYVVEAQVDCDPYEEECFVWECDPASTEEGEACTGDPEEDIWYYKIAQRNAGWIPLCDPEANETCDPWTCEPGEEECGEILCDEITSVEQEAECNDPEEYTLNNPPEEEEDLSADEAECEEGDAECEAAEEVACEEGDEECLSEESEGEESAPSEEAGGAEEESEEE